MAAAHGADSSHTLRVLIGFKRDLSAKANLPGLKETVTFFPLNDTVTFWAIIKDLRITITYQHRFINCEKWTILM